MEIKVDAEQVQKAVAEAILASTFGAQIKQIAERAGNEFVRTFDYTVAETLKQEARKIIIEEVTDKYLPQLREKVRATLNDKVVEDLVAAILKRLEGRW